MFIKSSEIFLSRHVVLDFTQKYLAEVNAVVLDNCEIFQASLKNLFMVKIKFGHV